MLFIYCNCLQICLIDLVNAVGVFPMYPQCTSRMLIVKFASICIPFVQVLYSVLTVMFHLLCLFLTFPALSLVLCLLAVFV